ncbi:MAG: PAS domain S-box protein [Syntrophobacteraceae bacterium]|nr:PAS domain S-box protein [Syntrophobacteraceae bacterium]
MVYTDLLLNLSFLVALSVISNFIEERRPRDTRVGVLLQGAVFGGAAVVGMLRPLILGPGLIFDGRSVMVSLCALYYGPLATAIATLMASACRVAIGGTGTVTGLLVIVSSAGIGLMARLRLKPEKEPPSASRLYLFGLAVHLTMVALMLTLPAEIVFTVLRRIGLPLLLIYPLATVLAGKILSDRLSTLSHLAHLKQSRKDLAITLQSIGDAVISTDGEARIVLMNPVAEQLTGWKIEEARGRPLEEVFRIVNENTRATVESPVERVIEEGVVVGLANHTMLIARNGTERPIADSGAPIRGDDGKITGVVLVFRDQSGERIAERLTAVRLHLIEYGADHSLDELLGEALDQVCALLNSPIGYYHFVESDQKTLCMQKFSTRTLHEFCQTLEKGLHYGIDSAGIWADCVREKKPVIHNDYGLLENKRGMPKGHVRVVRDLATPVIREGELVAILGVGNKPEEYTARDADTVGLLADVVWEIVLRKRAQESLKKTAEELGLSEGRLQRAEVAARFGNWEFILGSDTVLASEGARILYGLENRQWNTAEVKKIPLPEYRAILDTAMRELIENGKPYSVEFKICRPSDGEVIDIYSVAEYSPRRGRVFGVIQDITGRKRFEDALKESEQKYRLLADNVHDVIFTTDMDLKLTYLSPSAKRMHGWTPGEWQLLEPVDYLTPAAMELVQKTMSRELALEGSPGIDPGRVSVLEIEQYRKDGSTFWTEVSARFLRNQDGFPCGIIGTTRDISERKRSDAQAALLATAIEQADENILVTDKDRTILYVNPAFERSGGYSHEELKGEKLSFLRSARHDKVFYTNMKETLDCGRVWMGTIFNKGKNGDFEIEGTISPIRDSFGAITHYLAVGRNMGRFRTLERELYQAQKMESVGRLAGGVAHDFNNMLSVIVGQTELALLGISPDRPAYNRLQETLKAAHRSADLVRQLLAFARKQTISPKVLDINETVESMLIMVRRLIGEDIELRWNPGKDIWSVKMDPSQIDQILANLCINARDAIAGVGRLTISTGNVECDDYFCRQHAGVNPGRYVLLVVSDTGIGMDSNTRERIFEPFFTTKEVGKGTGLGLATVYGILEQNNGFVDVTSKPGQGTTFDIYLPSTEDQAFPKSDSGPVKVLKGQETVFLVEDEEPLLELGMSILEQHGYTVLAAQSPAAALAMVATHPGPIHLLLTDVVMPGMNGKDLKDRLIEAKPGLKTIFMSGYTADVIAHKGILDEGIDFLQKPFSVQTLLEKVREVLDREETVS